MVQSIFTALERFLNTCTAPAHLGKLSGNTSKAQASQSQDSKKRHSMRIPHLRVSLPEFLRAAEAFRTLHLPATAETNCI